MCEALAPFLRVPVSKLPSFAVAVCGLGPSLVQVTVSPTWIVIVAGVNLKSEIVSAGSPATCALGRRPKARIRLRCAPERSCLEPRCDRKPGG